MPTPAPTPDGQPLVAHHQCELMIPPAAAWRTISEADLLSTWYAFGGATIEPEVGGAFELSWEEGKVFRGRVAQIDPPRSLTYRMPQEAGVDVTDTNATTVRLEVGASADQDGRSTLAVTESGFEQLDPRYTPFDSFKAAQMAWIGAFGLLVQATGLPPQEEGES